MLLYQGHGMISRTQQLVNQVLPNKINQIKGSRAVVLSPWVMTWATEQIPCTSDIYNS